MKKFFVTLVAMAVFTLASQSAFAQYEKGDKLVNLGIGLGGTYGYGGVGLGGSFEVGAHEAISVGALAGFYSGGYYYSSSFILGARGSYHFNELLNLNDERFDLYAGAGLAYRSSTYWRSTITPLVHVGGRYYFKPNMGLFAELGSGFSALHAGIAFKF